MGILTNGGLTRKTGGGYALGARGEQVSCIDSDDKEHGVSWQAGITRKSSFGENSSSATLSFYSVRHRVLRLAPEHVLPDAADDRGAFLLDVGASLKW